LLKIANCEIVTNYNDVTNARKSQIARKTQIANSHKSQIARKTQMPNSQKSQIARKTQIANSQKSLIAKKSQIARKSQSASSHKSQISKKSQIARKSQIAEEIAVAAQSQTVFERIRNRSAIANDFEARNRSANAICFYKKFTSLDQPSSSRTRSIL
jgi:hypothetical protein